MNRERPAFAVPGIPAFLVLLVGMIALVVVVIWYIVNVLAGIEEGEALLRVIGFIVLLTVTLLWGYLFNGLTPVQPNEARVVVLFGKYDGTLHDPGLRWVNPLTERPKVSVRVRNFETSKLKVNDHDGNPIEIAAVVVWKVTDTAEASFEVND
jgi:regulator of protease activity HflC (stomatin/prohibitin superfamily)